MKHFACIALAMLMVLCLGSCVDKKEAEETTAPVTETVAETEAVTVETTVSTDTVVVTETAVVTE